MTNLNLSICVHWLSIYVHWNILTFVFDLCKSGKGSCEWDFHIFLWFVHNCFKADSFVSESIH